MSADSLAVFIASFNCSFAFSSFSLLAYGSAKVNAAFVICSPISTWAFFVFPWMSLIENLIASIDSDANWTLGPALDGSTFFNAPIIFSRAFTYGPLPGIGSLFTTFIKSSALSIMSLIFSGFTAFGFICV